MKSCAEDRFLIPRLRRGEYEKMAGSPGTAGPGNRLAWAGQLEEEKVPAVNPQVVEPSYQVSLVAVGDIMLARKVERLMQAHGTDYPFARIEHKLQEADITFGNLESPLSERGSPLPGKGICFRARPEMAARLKQAGLDVLSVANNHALDYDTDAFLDTLELLRSSQIEPVGGGRNIDEARQPVIIEKNGSGSGSWLIPSLRTSIMTTVTAAHSGLLKPSAG